MDIKKYLILFLLLPIGAFAQIAGESVYKFVTVPVSARSAALGGSGIAINDGDISLTRENPMLLSGETSQKLSFNHVGYVAGINYGHTNYAHHVKNVGTFGLGVQYFSGGEFIETDYLGNEYGSFGVNEYAFYLSYAKNFDSLFIIGATFKPVISQLESYSSFGLLMDLGIGYTTKSQLTTVTVLLSNMGAQITSYNNQTAPVPLNLQVGFCTKLAHAPFRFHVVASNLETPKLWAIQTNDADLRNVAKPADDEEEKVSMADKILTHGIFGVEFVPGKRLALRAGLNYRVRYELKHSASPGMMGFTWGIGLRISKFSLNYANVRYNYSSSGVSHHFGISTRLSDFL
jgi:long-subunit fatty acid transport protein